MIPKRNKKENSNRQQLLIAHYNGNSNISEQYRVIRTNIQFSSIDNEIRTIVVTSPTLGGGKTTTLANLGVVMAHQGKKVLLIDADLRRPSLHYLFMKSNRIGLTSTLVSGYTREEAIMATNINNLELLTSGPVPPNPSELLSSNKMEQLIDELKGVYDVLLIDSPPILNISDSQILANLCDGSILVLKSGETKKEVAALATNSLLNCKAKLIGAVLNQKKINKRDVYNSNN